MSSGVKQGIEDIQYDKVIIDVKKETIARRMLNCRRIENDVLHTVDFCVDGERYPPFRTCDKEKDRVVFQMGTSDAETALKVAKLVENDVAAIDVNMGCPKSFSLLGGMGAALLGKPDTVRDILTTLVNGVQKPVTCKIRVLPKLEDTLQLCQTIEKCGVSALAVHGRTKSERNQHENRDHFIQEISRTLNIPVIANGGSRKINCFEDIEKFRQSTSATSVMIARAAMRNVSILCNDGIKPLDVVIDEFLRYSVMYDNCPQMTKYTIQQMLQEQQQTTERGRGLLDAPPTLRDICKVWDLTSYHDAVVAKQRDRLCRETANTTCESNEDDPAVKIFTLDVIFIRKHFFTRTPKSMLNDYAKRKGLQPPTYESKQRPSDKRYTSVMTFEGNRFSSSDWQSSKRYSEQAAALVGTLLIGLDNELPSECMQDISMPEVDLVKTDFLKFTSEQIGLVPQR